MSGGILKYLYSFKKYAIFGTIFMFLEAVCDLISPFFYSKIIDTGLAGDKAEVFRWCIIMLSNTLISFSFGSLSARFTAISSTGFAKNIRKEIFKKIQFFSFANINKFSNSSLITRTTTDINNIQQSFLSITRNGIRAITTIISGFVIAFITAKQLSPIFAISLPILSIGVALIMFFSFAKVVLDLKQIDKINLVAQENLNNIRLVKSYVREEYENKKFQAVSNKHKKYTIFIERLLGLIDPLTQFIINFCHIFIIWYGIEYVLQGTLTIGQVSSFIIYTYKIMTQLGMLGSITGMYIIARGSAKRINEVLKEKNDIKNTTSSLKLEDAAIEFKNVYFKYSTKSEKYILSNINLKISSGETIGIIGSTASGKTTLVQLLPRLYDVLSGEIIVGKHNIKDYDLKTLRDQIAMVLQKNVLFSGTIRENLQWGNENATDNDILTACQNAQASEFIDTLPNGLDTILERGATNLSGGQKQRLCIARALLKNPKILILDDSTSAVDTATDARIRKVFAEKLIGMTKIIIAQRILSIKDADKIIVLDNGKINGIGKHEQLLENNEIYREIYYSQQESLE
ncbi:MAG: ABC transporter ATP-binding protein [Rickettsiales bacterium]|nr:MAG: ABC transporter ATP-binding protein [Rickettsiales bacterium]